MDEDRIEHLTREIDAMKQQNAVIHALLDQMVDLMKEMQRCQRCPLRPFLRR